MFGERLHYLRDSVALVRRLEGPYCEPFEEPVTAREQIQRAYRSKPAGTNFLTIFRPHVIPSRPNLRTRSG